MISPKFEMFSERYKNAKFVKIDVDKLEEVATEQGIRAMPTFIVFIDGKKVEEMVGAGTLLYSQEGWLPRYAQVGRTDQKTRRVITEILDFWDRQVVKYIHNHYITLT